MSQNRKSGAGFGSLNLGGENATLLAEFRLSGVIGGGGPRRGSLHKPNIAVQQVDTPSGIRVTPLSEDGHDYSGMVDGALSMN
jgi:hypothetical protein